ncbi:hypothetical protein G6F31_018950 [Rhizopus arrhizus]|nr:hypothetical protein G6F31_018950 [Rhizopus arrhizus]
MPDENESHETFPHHRAAADERRAAAVHRLPEGAGGEGAGRPVYLGGGLHRGHRRSVLVPQRLRRSAEAGRRCGAEVRQQGSLREGLQAGTVRAAAHVGGYLVHRPDDDGLLHVADAEQPRRPGPAGAGGVAGLPGQERWLGAPGPGR